MYDEALQYLRARARGRKIVRYARLMNWSRWRRSCRLPRKRNGEATADTDCALDVDFTAVQLYDLIHEGEPEPSAAGDLLHAIGSVEQLENVRQFF